MRSIHLRLRLQRGQRFIALYKAIYIYYVQGMQWQRAGL